MWRFLLPCICLLAFSQSFAVAEVGGKRTPANVVEFSHGRGLYDNPFRLSLSSPSNATIYYSLDGSKPDESTGLRYSQPVKIDKTTVVRAAAIESGQPASIVTTHTFLFPSQVWKQPPNPDRYVRSAISQRHGPSRPQEFDWAMDPGLLTNPADRKELLDGLKDLPSLAVTVFVDDFNYLYKHHRSRGSEFERPVSLELIYPNKSKYKSHLGFQIDCGIRMHGGLAVDQARKKSFRVLFKKKYGEGKLEYPIFESAAHHAASATNRFDTLVLRAGGNGNWSKDIAWKHEPGMYLRDTLVRDSQIAMSGFGSRSTFVHLYINGLYYGVFNIAERPDSRFMASYCGGESDDYYSINHNGTVDGDSTRWDRARRARKLHEQVDVAAFCDYIILNWATGMGDWPWNNYYAGVRNAPPGSIRFFAWDAEHAFWTNAGYLYSNPNGWVNPFFLDQRANSFRSRNLIVEIWRALVKDPEFKMVFADRVHRHLFGDGELSDTKLAARFQRLVAQLDKAMVAESCRWGDSAWGREDRPHTRDHDFRGNCRKVAKLIENNSVTFLQALRKHDLHPEVEAPELSESTTNPVSPRWKLQFRDSSGASDRQIYYTVDGSDPRLAGGKINPKAKQWEGSSITIDLSRAVRLRARTKLGTEWSAQLDTTIYSARIGNPIRFTELMYQPSEHSDDQALEFIELQNTSNVALDLNRCHLDGVDYLFPPNRTIAPMEVIVLVPNDAPDRFQERYPTAKVFGTYRKHLANEGERIAVVDAHGKVITQVRYEVSGSWPGGASGTGMSIHCRDVDNAEEPTSWRAAPPTPGTVTSGI